jgi:outer membrane protein OmpA-like peptidoglycan-associated protein
MSEITRIVRLTSLLVLLPLTAAASAAAQEVARPDLLTLAQGAVPLTVGGAGAAQGANLSHALRIVDGHPGGFTMVNRATDQTDTEFVYEMPAPTTFDRFAVPDVLETPSPSQTFTRHVEVFGSDRGPEGPWTLLASAELSTHAERGLVTELELRERVPVRWIRLRLVGGIEMLRDAMFLEFGEIVGNGTQETPELDADRFTGSWWDRGVRLTLAQEGATVTGCYDTGSPVTGTVSSNVFRGIGRGRDDGIVSHFILGVTEDGQVRGVRSTNGAPFALYSGAPSADRSVDCLPPDEPPVGCGSVIHGITFAFDSAELLAQNEPVLDALAVALRDDPAGRITIEGHTSSEGSEEYNRALSDRRARSVAAALGLRGVEPGRLDPIGIGEARPIASNDDEAGRSMNRRVEIHCS